MKKTEGWQLQMKWRTEGMNNRGTEGNEGEEEKRRNINKNEKKLFFLCVFGREAELSLDSLWARRDTKRERGREGVNTEKKTGWKAAASSEERKHGGRRLREKNQRLDRSRYWLVSISELHQSLWFSHTHSFCFKDSLLNHSSCFYYFSTHEFRRRNAKICGNQQKKKKKKMVQSHFWPSVRPLNQHTHIKLKFCSLEFVKLFFLFVLLLLWYQYITIHIMMTHYKTAVVSHFEGEYFYYYSS